MGAVGILLFTKAGGALCDTVGPAGPFIMMGLVQAVMLVAAIAVRVTAAGPQINQINS